METIKIKQLNKWANAHTHYSIDLIRIALGVFLIIKGFSFFFNNHQFEDAIAPISNFMGGLFILHYILPAHIIGGFLITIGLLTRWSILAILPILIGAVVINFIGDFNLLNFILASTSLLVSIFFLIYGSGKHSADYYFKMQK